MNKIYISTNDVLTRLAGSDLPTIDTLSGAVVQRKLCAGEALFHAGERHPYAFVVNQGIIKLVYETPAGDSWIKGFAEAGVCFASLTALQANGLTSFSAYAVVDSVIEKIEYQKLQLLAKQHIEWQCLLGNAFKFYGLRKEQREMELLTLSPEERYLNFLNKYPELVTKLKQREIASYIRVTSVALSRIKTRMRISGRLP